MSNVEGIDIIAAGTAKIKAIYVIKDHVRELNLNFVAAKDQRNVKKSAENDSYDEPPKKKLKGQNKHRPREKKVPKAEKLCFKVGIEGSCPFGDRCCYSHDVDSYLAKKPPDIGDNCYLYESFGKCPYSFSCRFASTHIKDGKNLIKQDIVDKLKDTQFYRNSLMKEWQKSLRRRDYDFSKSNKVLKEFECMKTCSNKNSDKCKHVEVKESFHLSEETRNSTLQNHISDDSKHVEGRKESLDLLKETGDSTGQSQISCDSKHIEIKKDPLYLSEETGSSTLQNQISYECKHVEVKKDPLHLSEETGDSTVQSQISCESKHVEVKKESLHLSEKTEDSALQSEISCESKSLSNVPDLNLNSEKSVGTIIENDKNDLSKIKKVDFKDKLYLAPLTTVGNLPFRRICKEFGADITCSEMAMSLSLLQGQQSEWALLKRHHTEDVFGIQICGAHPDVMTRCSQLLSETVSFDFLDLNLGCPLEMVYKKGAGCGLMNRLNKLEGIIYGITSVIDVPLTLKMRTGIYGGENIAHNVIKKVHQWKDQVSLITLHGRSREQRYTKSANWEYINLCNKYADPIPLFGSGDVLTFEDYNRHRNEADIAGAMIARGALIKPWIFTEIKEQRHWDISSSERFDILKSFTHYGLEHWGSDTEGVEKTRRFLLEWLSFLYRYIPVGLLECPPQHINERPPPYVGRNDLETLMASPSCNDWVKISQMLLGPVPENFVFLPKHKANAYQ